MEQTTTTTEAKVWRGYVDDRYLVYFVDYDMNLNNQMPLLQRCIDDNSLYPLDENVYDFWDFPEEYDLEQVRQKMAADGLEDEFENNRDEIREWIWEHDESTPTEDLLRNTGNINVFYSICEADCYWVEAPFMQPYMAEQPGTTAYKLCKKLGIAKGTESYKQIVRVCQNANYGGELRIYWADGIENLISGKPFPKGKNEEWQTIKLKGTFAVAIYNPNEGAGDFEFVELDTELPFIRSNLRISDTERYDIEQCFGMSYDWCSKGDTPAFSFDKPKRRVSIKQSVVNEREKHFEEVFKAGGCSTDDDNYSRHRDVYYRNDFPCGSVCPHCGHIWYD